MEAHRETHTRSQVHHSGSSPHFHVGLCNIIFVLCRHWGNAKVLVKSDIFKWPLRGLLLWAGAIPVDRGKGASFTRHMIDAVRRKHTCTWPLHLKGHEKLQKTGKPGFIRFHVPLTFRFTTAILTGAEGDWRSRTGPDHRRCGGRYAPYQTMVH